LIRVGGTGGNVAVVNHLGDTVTITGCPAGEWLRGQFQKINTTNTTVAAADLTYYL